MGERLMPWSDPRYVKHTPIVTTVLLEWANVGQVWKMWRVHSSLGQNPWSWLGVQLALWGWLNFYRVMVDKDKRAFAFYGTLVGIFLNAAVCLTVLHFAGR